MSAAPADRVHHAARPETDFFAPNLRLMLRRRQIELPALARRLCIDSRRMARLASGWNAPHYSELPKFAAVLGVRPEELAWMPTEELAALTRPA